MSKEKKTWRTKLLLLVIASGVVFCAFFATNGFLGAFKEDKNVVVEIKTGMTGDAISEMLEKQGVVYNRMVFKAFLRVSGKASEIKVGSFELSPKMSYTKILETLTGYSKAALVKVTVPEGYKLVQVASVMEKNGLCTTDEFLKEAANGEFSYAFLEGIPQGEANRLEGFLFPDTYFFDKFSNPHTIIDTMLKEFERVYTAEISEKAKGFGMTTREFITLASIIEKEGVGDLDKISSVFHNRLDIGMRLESCATVNYLFDEPKDVLSLEDTHIESPYNTYRNAGLPPTPICSPGKATIEAAANPADTDYLFFIADGNGGNLFSENFEQHKQKKGNR